MIIKCHNGQPILKTNIKNNNKKENLTSGIEDIKKNQLEFITEKYSNQNLKTHCMGSIAE